MPKDAHINVYGGSPLNRLAWLRTSHGFLNAIVLSPHSRWILFNAGKPLVVSGTPTSLAYLSTSSVLPLLGNQPLFGQGQEEATPVDPEQLKLNAHVLQAARHRGPPVVFLGIREKEGERVLPEKEVDVALKEGGTDAVEKFLKKDQATPYFVLDVADKDLFPNFDNQTKDAAVQEFVDNVAKGLDGKKLEWVDPRAAVGNMDLFEAGVFAESRTMADWNLRNKAVVPVTIRCGEDGKLRVLRFFPGMQAPKDRAVPHGKIISAAFVSPIYSLNRIGLHNYAHPRTDPVAIILTVDQTGDKILLGRSRKFPPKLYSALAGFLEPAETFEDCVVREVWEEVGVKVWGIQYHSGQPWPYPANLMLGWYCRGDSTKEIRLDLDNELEDAKWVSRAEILAILGHKTGTTLDSKTFSEKMEVEEQERILKEQREGKSVEAKPQAVVNDGGPTFTFPPNTAMAGVLIRDWAEGRMTFAAENV
ncbi:NADH pyrophosphatase [Marasmius crinis-equi]|uniref:NAD(+) diphosphatase n=1 Tax=Marasmius crinis-equi TaxID=585013 RepID=A0ABR3G0G0_9AGAR